VEGGWRREAGGGRPEEGCWCVGPGARERSDAHSEIAKHF
jgi:hypothetical protein